MATKHLDDIRFGGSEDERPLSSSACPINVSLGAEVGTNLSLPRASWFSVLMLLESAMDGGILHRFWDFLCDRMYNRVANAR